ncbi:hypothetical protein AgCh_003743 [Apium graveolens]
MEKEVEFDILNWWKLNGPKFPVLARMARDILAIPTFSVASENSFSKCRRIITDTRSSLNDESIETLMCVKDWLPELKDGSSLCLQDESVLIWFSGKEEKLLKLSHVSRIISGQRTKGHH